MLKGTEMRSCATAAIVLFAFAGCTDRKGTPSTDAPATGTYSIELTVATPAGLPKCTSALAGTTAYVQTPIGLYSCQGGNWIPIPCLTVGGGAVAYSSATQTLLACVSGAWTPVPLPQGPAGMQGPAGAQGATGAPGTSSLINATSEPAGEHCANGGVRIEVGRDANNDGVLGADEVASVQYVCNATLSSNDGGAPDGDGGPGVGGGGPHSFDQPGLQWSWTATPPGDPAPGAVSVMSAPAVADVNEDGAPDIVVGTTNDPSTGLLVPGYLRALDGATGTLLFTVPSPMVNAAASVAVGDLDLDGHVDIVAVDASGTHLVAFSRTGAVEWTSPALEQIGWGAPAIANIDGTSTPEVVIGRQVLDGKTGALRWTGAGAPPPFQVGLLPLVVDLDADGVPEVLAGANAYRSTGELYWSFDNRLSFPFTAVGNFDADPLPEVVLVGGGSVRMLEHDGTLKWGPVSVSTTGLVGPPTIADFDGDGQPEIGIGNATGLAVFEGDGSLRWSAAPADPSGLAGASAFDFDGDGAAEIVYHDANNMYVLDGRMGTTLFQTATQSCTWFEYPVIADVDGDGSAEIVDVGNSCGGIPPHRGIYVYGDVLRRWLPGRKIWNQYGYHVTNVGDDGSIPEHEPASWLAGNTYRAQRSR